MSKRVQKKSDKRVQKQSGNGPAAQQDGGERSAPSGSFGKRVENEVAAQLAGSLAPALNDDVVGAVVGFVKADALPTANEMGKLGEAAKGKWVQRCARILLERCARASAKLKEEYTVVLAPPNYRLYDDEAEEEAEPDEQEFGELMCTLHNLDRTRQYMLVEELQTRLRELGYLAQDRGVRVHFNESELWCVIMGLYWGTHLQ